MAMNAFIRLGFYLYPREISQLSEDVMREFNEYDGNPSREVRIRRLFTSFPHGQMMSCFESQPRRWSEVIYLGFTRTCLQIGRLLAEEQTVQ